MFKNENRNDKKTGKKLDENTSDIAMYYRCFLLHRTHLLYPLNISCEFLFCDVTEFLLFHPS